MQPLQRQEDEFMMTKVSGNLTTQEALAYLGIGRSAFFKRIRDGKIKAVNYNPALEKQHKPLWSTDDLDRLKNAKSNATT
jgi:hypothetical protein